MDSIIFLMSGSGYGDLSRGSTNGSPPSAAKVAQAPFAKLVPYGAGVPRRELIGSDDKTVVIHPDFYEPVGEEHLEPFYERRE